MFKHKGWEMWTPRLQWIPEHCIHMNIPRFHTCHPSWCPVKYKYRSSNRHKNLLCFCWMRMNKKETDSILMLTLIYNLHILWSNKRPPQRRNKGTSRKIKQVCKREIRRFLVPFCKSTSGYLPLLSFELNGSLQNSTFTFLILASLCLSQEFRNRTIYDLLYKTLNSPVTNLNKLLCI